MSKLIITRMETPTGKRLMNALEEGGRIRRLYPVEEGEACPLNRILTGRVERIVPGQHAAFVRIGPDQRGYLHLKEEPYVIYADGKTGGTQASSERKLRAGDAILVQICREAMKGKLPGLTARLSIPLRGLVLTADPGEKGASSKLPARERTRLLTLMDQLSAKRYPQGRPFGFILRTNACGMTKEQLLEEYTELERLYTEVFVNGRHRTDGSIVYDPEPPVTRMIRDIKAADLEKILTDDRQLYERIGGYLSCHIPELADRLTLYDDRLLPLPALFSLGKVLEEALGKRVWLKGGGFLVIEQTEAFVSIDVNSGKDLKGNEAQETYRRINLEAASEIARQLRLRELSGMILIDFITMKEKESSEELLGALRSHVRNDHVPTNVVDMTPLGIVEVTRRRQCRPLAEAMR